MIEKNYTMGNVEHILAAQNTLGEGPLWSIKEQALYWVDILNNCYWRLEPTSGTYEVTQVGGPIGVLAQREMGGLVMAIKHHFALWDTQAHHLQRLGQAVTEQPHVRFNDGAVDCGGRFWAGTMSDHESADGTLYRLDPDGSIHIMETSVGVSNGIGWSPDNLIMYFTDSPRRMIYAYDFDPVTGEIDNRRIFVHTPDEVGQPDGLAVDSEGCIWSCYWDGAKIVRYTPTGKVERVIPMPVLRPTSCAFGGAHLNELYITSASVDLTAQQKAQYPFSGDLFRLKTDVRGLPQLMFNG